MAVDNKPADAGSDNSTLTRSSSPPELGVGGQRRTSGQGLGAGVLARIRGVAGTAGMVNANGRLYPRAVYEGVVERFGSLPPGDALLGELDHPDWPHTPRLERTALRVTDLQLSPEGRLEFSGHVLDTPAGRTLHSLLGAGVPVHVSTRGAGSLHRVEGKGKVPTFHEVSPDYELHGIDAVVRGAQPGARITGHEGATAQYPQLPRIERRETMQVLTEEMPDGRLIMEVTPPTAEDTPPAKGQSDETPLAESPGAEEGSEGTEASLHPSPFSLVSSNEVTVEMITRLQGEVMERDAQIQRLQAECQGARDALAQHQAGQEVSRVVAGLRPDLRRTVQGQLAGCSSPAEVQERWTAIESVLGAAGLLREEPAGLGHSALAETTPADSYTPVQQIQRRLLGR